MRLNAVRDINKEIPVLVFANKQDLPNAMTMNEGNYLYFEIIYSFLVATGLRLGEVDHVWHVQPCIASTGQGLYEGLNWLYRNVQK